MHPEGDFQLLVANAYIGENSFGHTAIMITCQSDYGPVPIESELEGQWLEKTVRALRSMGWRGNDISTAPAVIKGKKASVWIRHKTAKSGGKVYMVASLSLRSSCEAFEPDKAKAVAASLANAIAALGGDEEAPPAGTITAAEGDAIFDGKPTVARDAPVDDSDIPF